MNWGQAKALIRWKLQDPNAIYWSDAKILGWADEFLSNISRKSEANLKKIRIPLTSGTRTYSLPSDCYEIRRVTINLEKCFGSTAFDLSDLDVSFLTATGKPQWYYIEGVNSLAFYPVPSWTASLTTFTSESGEVNQFTDGSNTYTAISEYGIVTDLIDTSSSKVYLLDSLVGEVVEVDSNAYVADVTYVYEMADLVNDSDPLDVPIYMQYAMIYGVLTQAFLQEGQTRNERLSQRYKLRTDELLKEWYSRNREFARGQDQMLTQQPVDWGSDLVWRQRVWP